MPAVPDLTRFNEEQLDKIAKDASKLRDKLKKDREAAEGKERQKKIDEFFKGLGYKDHADYLAKTDGPKAKKAKKPTTKGEPKYRHPENPEKTWTGKGRAPKWITEHEAAGGRRESLLIERE